MHFQFRVIFLKVSPMGNTNSIAVTDPVTLEQLDDFSLLSIFDQLPLLDLVKLATLSPRFEQLISHHYIIGKYHIQTRKVTLTISHDVSMTFNSDDLNVVTTLAHNHDETRFVLQHFGHIFHYLDINVFEYGYAFTANISHLINTYCARAHQELRLKRGIDRDDVSILLANVTKVEITHTSGTTNKDNFRLDLAFPQMKSLDISRQMDLDHNYSHLTEFILRASDYQSNIDYYTKFMQFNPQLHTIQLPLFNDGTFLPTINELYPRLESFALEVLNEQYIGHDAIEITRFSNVKKFSIELYIHGESVWTNELREIIASIRFERLESFAVITYVRDSIDFLIEWIVGNTALETVTLVGREMNFEQLTALITPLTKLKVLTMVWTFESTLGVLNRFLAHNIAINGTLENINVEVNQNGQFSYEDMVGMVPRGWNYYEGDIVQNPRLVQLYRSV